MWITGAFKRLRATDVSVLHVMYAVYKMTLTFVLMTMSFPWLYFKKRKQGKDAHFKTLLFQVKVWVLSWTDKYTWTSCCVQGQK